MNVEGMSTQIKLSKSDLQTAKALGQLDRKYIMIKIENKLVMIDQHAADERVKLELMTARLSCPEISDLVTLEPSISIHLPLSQSQLVNERLPRFLKHWGIHIATTDYKCDDTTSEDAETIVSRSRYFSTNEASPHFTDSHKSHSTRYYVTRLPRIIADRCLQNQQLLNDLIFDYMHWIEQEQYYGHDSALIRVCPRGIMEILKSKACRGNIFHI
jgi:DNA mismatch repair ATPase MutL